MNVTVQSVSPGTTPDGGSRSIGPITVVGTIALYTTELVLANGNNTIAVPAGAVGCIISPPPGQNIALKIKPIVGDTGMAIPQNSSCPFFFDTTAVPASFVINAAAGTATLPTTVTFF